MRCPFCSNEETQVKDSRPTEDGTAIRRRRYCPDCSGRFTTFERVQLRELMVLFKLRIVVLLLAASVGGAFLGAGGWPGWPWCSD